MTTEKTMTRNERAQLTLEATVREALQSPSPKEVRVSAHDNNSFEPSFYVHVTMPSKADIPDEKTRNRVAGKMIRALEGIDEDRFAYLYFGPRDQSGAEQSDDESELGPDEDLL